MVQQVSWKVDSIEEVQAFHRLFKERNIPVQYEVTHGNAVSIYFYDPEGNRNEVYYSVKADVRQPFRKSINLEQLPEQVLAENRRLIEQGGGRPT
jgi:catechol-2,3-dioxygenase